MLLPFTHRTQAAAYSGDSVAAQEAREAVDGITIEQSGAAGGHAEGTSLETSGPTLEEVRESTCLCVLMVWSVPVLARLLCGRPTSNRTVLARLVWSRSTFQVYLGQGGRDHDGGKPDYNI